MSEQGTPVAKSELLNWLEQANRQWEEFLAEIGPLRMEQPGVNGDWSMKDIIAHMTGWERRLVADLQAAQHGEPDPPPPWPTQLQTEDDINAWIYEANRGRSLQAVLDEMRQTHRQLVDDLAALPEDVRVERVEPAHYLVWVGDKRFLAGESFHHFYDEHESDVRAWLARSTTNPRS